MLRDPHLTDGIGVRTALNIPFTSTKDVLVDLDLTSATSAKQRKTKMNAQPKALNRTL
jgi:hypothetical protein